MQFKELGEKVVYVIAVSQAASGAKLVFTHEKATYDKPETDRAMIAKLMVTLIILALFGIFVIKAYEIGRAW